MRKVSRFCFEARQKRIMVDEEYYYMDMVFYNRMARFGVVLELKSHKLDYKDVAQLNIMVEYATTGIDENLFISKYLLKLPSQEEMERWLQKELQELR